MIAPRHAAYRGNSSDGGSLGNDQRELEQQERLRASFSSVVFAEACSDEFVLRLATLHIVWEFQRQMFAAAGPTHIPAYPVCHWCWSFPRSAPEKHVMRAPLLLGGQPSQIKSR